MGIDIVLFILYMAILGAAIGTFSGLVPGIHVNTLAALMLAGYPFLKGLFSPFIPSDLLPLCVASCIMSASIVHSFVDYVPSVFIGAPDPDDIISALPGHRLLLEGRGMAAVRSAAIGSCVGSCVSIVIAIPLQLILLSGLSDYLDSITSIVLISVILLMILHEKEYAGMAWCTAIIFISGLLGLACMDLDIPGDGLLGEGTLLFPMLTGLFGMPALLESLHNPRIVEQKDDERYPVGPIPGIKGVLTGILTGWFPGITSTTGAILSGSVTPERRPEGFIAMTASIGTSASIIMLVTMSITGHGRSGTMIIIGDILGDSVIGPMNGCFIALLLTAAFAAFLGYHSTVICGRIMSKVINMIDVLLLNKICIMLILALVFLMTGPFGLVILFVSTLMGFLPMRVGISRVYLTGCLLIPALLSSLLLRGEFLSFLL